jgi:transcriptional regulator with XRE-family HTH domain
MAKIMSFKENLKAELVYSGMLVKELSAKTGIKKHTIDNYLNTHNAIPSADYAVRIAQALGVSVEYLVTGEESESIKRPSDDNPPPVAKAPGNSANVSSSARKAAQIVDGLSKENRTLALLLLKAIKRHAAA